MKLYKLFKVLLALLFLLTASINISLAAGTFETCPGIARDLSWTSSNSSVCSAAPTIPQCRFTPVPNQPGNRSVTIDDLSGSCNATISCTGPGSATPISDTATLNVVNQASCCGTGSQTNKTKWVTSGGSWVINVPTGPEGDYDTIPCSTQDPSLAPGLGCYQSPGTGTCSCPDGQYNDGVNTCANLEVTTVTAVYSGLDHPLITPSCPAPLTAVSVIRNVGPSTNLTGVNGNNPISDSVIVSGVNAETYTYTLTCRGTGLNSHITTTGTTTLTVPPRVKITDLENISVPTGSSVNVTWNSTGNECSIFARGPRTYIGTSYRNNNGVNASYSHSFTISPSAPQYRTELNSSHIGSNTLGYDVECIDSAQPIRGTAVDAFTAEIFKKPIATITGPNASNQLTFSCTPDYNKVDIRVNGTSLTGYPKTYALAPSSNFSTTLAASANSSYLLICSYGLYSDSDGLTTSIVTTVPPTPNNTLMLYGNMNGINKSATDIITVNSADGKVNELFYKAENFDSVTVTRTNDGSTIAPGSYSAVGGTARVTTGVDTRAYNNFNLVVTARKGIETKTLTFNLNKTADLDAKITLVPSPTPTNIDNINITITCKNATSYELYKNTFLVSGYPKNTTSDNFSTTVSDTASGSGAKTTYKVRCIKGTDNKEASADIGIPSNTKANITALLIQPAQIACPGGNDTATLKFVISNTIGKTCRVSTSAVTNNLNPIIVNERNEQMSRLNTALNSSNYKSSNSDGTTKSLRQVIDNRDGRDISAGSIVLSTPTTLSSGKRLFNYSTRFTMECDSSALPIASRSNITYSSKSVDMLSACVGQD